MEGRNTVSIPLEGLMELIECKARMDILHDYVASEKGCLDDSLIRRMVSIYGEEEE